MRKLVSLVSAIAIAALAPAGAFAQQPPPQQHGQTHQGQPKGGTSPGKPSSPSKGKPDNGAHGGASKGKSHAAPTGQPSRHQPAPSPHGKPQGHSKPQHQGAGDWRRQGGKLPPGRGRVVNDYSRHRLAPPPPGYHWVQDGNDFLLAAVATGIIGSIIAGSHN